MLAKFYFLAQQGEPVLEQLDRSERVQVLMALGSIVVLGIVMIVLVWLAGRAVRRYINYEPDGRRNDTVVEHDDWVRKPLVPPYQGPTSPEDS